MLARPLTVLALVLGLTAPGLPGWAAAPPGSSPPAAAAGPAYALQPVSGRYPGEQEVRGAMVDTSADGRHVLYTASLDGSRSGLLLHDRTAGTTRLVDHMAGEPGTPSGTFDTPRGALSADGGTVAWVSSDEGVVEEDAPVYRDAYVYGLSSGGA